MNLKTCTARKLASTYRSYSTVGPLKEIAIRNCLNKMKKMNLQYIYSESDRGWWKIANFKLIREGSSLLIGIRIKTNAENWSHTRAEVNLIATLGGACPKLNFKDVSLEHLDKGGDPREDIADPIIKVKDDYFSYVFEVRKQKPIW
jgi:hypothetical protein